MSRVINLRGTSGAGKTYIVRDIMARYATREPEMVPGRKQPIAYTCTRPNAPPLYVVGHYEGACGGCDTIGYSASSRLLHYDEEDRGGMELIYHLITKAATRGDDVIFEGLVVASDWRRCAALRHTHQLLVVGLNTSLADCCKAVQERRDTKAISKGKDLVPLNRKNTEAKYKALLTQRKYFRDNGVDFRLLDRAAALEACVNFLAPWTPAAESIALQASV